MVEIPYYLKAKLALVGINSILQLHRANYLKVYKWLKDIYPSLNHNALFDLYCLSNNLAINNLSPNSKQQILFQFKNTLPTYIPLDCEVISCGLSKAQEQADIAARSDEVPIGAVVYHNDEIISVGYNQTITKCNIMGHAEIIAISNAQSVLGNYRLTDCDLYVTVEPCLMCSGAIISSRIRRVIFGAIEPKTGAVISQFRVFDNSKVNHTTEAIGPINNELYSAKIQQFFQQKRADLD
ncbi:MAG: nucleoside deaminase [Proteobacteria bacterium]|jgi:tRNA(Arg) A34 adenosine deaminase TadA|nr:nucleoside deaminase [Pseudomonadota bacterium]